jgi:hypothetical protein
MEAVVHREMCPGQVEISLKEITAAAESSCDPADSSFDPPSIPDNDQPSRSATEQLHHKGMYTLHV